MHAEYKRDLQNNYLVIEVSGCSADEDYELKMAEQNEISGLLSFHSSKMNGDLYLNYEITSKHSLDSLYAGKELGFSELIFILNGIREALEQLQKYLLNPAQLVFDPQYIYVDANRKNIQLCYLPGEEQEGTIDLLAEFFLKKLDHQDRKAVELGYRFYQQTLEENFSLKKTLKEILVEERSGTGWGSEQDYEETEEGNVQAFGRKSEYEHRKGDRSENKYRTENKYRSENKYRTENEYRNENKHRTGNEYRNGKESKSRKGTDERHNYKKDRKAGSEEGIPERMFQKIHPAVLLSTLLLLVILEIVFYFGYIGLTEFGGMFFLILAAEVMINRHWKRLKKQEEHYEKDWMVREDSREYREIREEMYPMKDTGMDTKVLAEQGEGRETQILTEQDSEVGMWLIYRNNGVYEKERPDYPNIFVGRKAVLLGKLQGESDVILNCSTVSRTHARLFQRKGHFYVKDLNSKNGTFLNGEKLNPQERREFVKGDRIVFSEVEYQVIDRMV